jgi:hypothetical protein
MEMGSEPSINTNFDSAAFFGTGGQTVAHRVSGGPSVMCLAVGTGATRFFYDDAENLIETHEQTGDFKEW